MSAITIVNMRPYPVALTTGRHVYPGEVTEVNKDENVERLVADGAFYTVPSRPDTKTEPGNKASREGTDKESTQE